MAENAEVLELEVEGKFVSSNLTTLQTIASHFGLSKTSELNSKLTLIKALRKFTDSSESVEEKVELLTKMLELFAGEIDGKTGNIERDNARQLLESQVGNLEAQLIKLKSELGYPEPKKDGSITLLEQTLSRTMLKKEFKITGMIHAQKSDKPSLNYISLIHQIEAGQRQKYSDEEIISGVIRAMTPGLKLRTVLETLPNLKLPRVRLMLRSHYSERSPAELFQLLTNSIQGGGESADDFLIKVYEVRQKLVFARKESGSLTVPYDDSLIQSIFINTVETGITDEAIRNKIRPCLVAPKEGQTEDDFEKVNDELIKQINIATATEFERNEKFKSASRRRTGISAVEVDEGFSTTEQKQLATGTRKKTGLKDSVDNQLIATLQAIQSQLGTLRQDVNTLKANSPSTSSEGRYTKSRCKTCVTDNNEFCDHCFKCGSSEHFARGCKKFSTNSSRH